MENLEYFFHVCVVITLIFVAYFSKLSYASLLLLLICYLLLIWTVTAFQITWIFFGNNNNEKERRKRDLKRENKRREILKRINTTVEDI